MTTRSMWRTWGLTLALAALMAAILSCSKSGPKKMVWPEYRDPSELLVGTWQWVQSVGGIGGWTQTPASEGYSLVCVYRPDGVFEAYRNNERYKQTTYRVTTEPAPWSPHPNPEDEPRQIRVVHYGDAGDSGPGDEVRASEEELTLIGQCMDCFESRFRRVR